MKTTDVKIDDEFECSGAVYRCTDIGTRTVIGIQVSSVTVGSTKNGVHATQELGRKEAERGGWFNGPPYAVMEVVFDEDDLEVCEPVPNGQSKGDEV